MNITAPTINRYDTESVMNVSDGENMFVKLVQFVSNPNPEIKEPFDYTPGLMILLTIFSIIFLYMKMRGVSTTAAFFSASLVNLIVAVLLYPLQVISGIVFIGTMVIFMASVAWAWFDSRM